jgi:hypothetical protein
MLKNLRALRADWRYLRRLAQRSREEDQHRLRRELKVIEVFGNPDARHEEYRPS